MSDIEVWVENLGDKDITAYLRVGKSEKEFIVPAGMKVTQNVKVTGVYTGYGCAALPVLMILVGIISQVL